MPFLLILACSGPGAADSMATASLIGLLCLGLSLAATVVVLFRARRLPGALPKLGAAAAVLLLVAHPTFWLGVSSGDCGEALRVAGPVTTMLQFFLAGLLLQAKG